MKILHHYNSGFWIFPRVLHIQTNQLHKHGYFKIHSSGVTYRDKQDRGWEDTWQAGIKTYHQHYGDFRTKSLSQGGGQHDKYDHTSMEASYFVVTTGQQFTAHLVDW